MVERTKSRKGKRADGEGSLRWSETKKLWIGRVMVGYRPDGKPDIREVTAKAQKSARSDSTRSRRRPRAVRCQTHRRAARLSPLS